MATPVQIAAEHTAVVLVHSGDVNSAPDDYVPFADRFPETKIILAHLGNGGAAAGSPELQVRALPKARGDNLFIDTSSARSILPGLVEWAVKEVGAEKILYGTRHSGLLCPHAVGAGGLHRSQRVVKRKILRRTPSSSSACNHSSDRWAVGLRGRSS